MKNTRLVSGMLLAACGTLLFSTKAVLVKFAYRDAVDPVTLITLRMAFSAPCYAVVAWRLGRRRPALVLTDRAWLTALGVFGFYLAGLLDFKALTDIPVALERLLLYVYPTLVVVGSALMLRRRVSARDRVALLITYGGLALILLSGGHTGRSFGHFWTGVSLVLGSAVVYAANLIGSERLIGRVGASRATANAMLAASLAAVTLFLLKRRVHELSEISPFVYADALALAMFATVLPSFLLAAGIARIGAARAALIGMFGPVVTIGLAWFLLGEPIGWIQGVGGVLIVAGVVLTSVPGTVSADGSGTRKRVDVAGPLEPPLRTR
ncbi:MAG: DMT family transporter [Acidiferrobacteraceae bacterium]